MPGGLYQLLGWSINHLGGHSLFWCHYRVGFGMACNGLSTSHLVVKYLPFLYIHSSAGTSSLPIWTVYMGSTQTQKPSANHCIKTLSGTTYVSLPRRISCRHSYKQYQLEQTHCMHCPYMTMYGLPIYGNVYGLFIYGNVWTVWECIWTAHMWQCIWTAHIWPCIWTAHIWPCIWTAHVWQCIWTAHVWQYVWAAHVWQCIWAAPIWQYIGTTSKWQCIVYGRAARL